MRQKTIFDKKEISASEPRDFLKLSVKDFSCIKEADISINRLTVLIGPQASGKSLLSKLIYFFNSLVLEQQSSDDFGESLDSFKNTIKERFQEWFPISAWGTSQFKIEYTQGNYSIRIVRSTYNGIVGDNLKIWLSKSIQEFHDEKLKIWRSIHDQQQEEDADELDLLWRAQKEARILLRKSIGDSFLTSQIFIPAGRSFFTTIGKAVAAFEHARLLDPITIAFGKRLANYRDRGGPRTVVGSKTQSISILDQAVSLIGGKVIFNKNGDFVATSDGRKIPFGSLSSGQQELLPLLMILDQISGS